MGRGAIYYVDSLNGLDTNEGLSWDNALKTITAAANKVAAGDIVYVNRGVYKEIVRVRKEGSSLEKMITFKAIGEVIIDAGGFDLNFVGVFPPDTPYPHTAAFITIDGFIFKNSGIYSDQYCVGNIFENLKFIECNRGVYISAGTQNKIDKCLFIAC